YASPPISLRRTPTFPHPLPSSGNLRFYSGAPPLEIGFYVFTRYFTPEMGAILLVNEALSSLNQSAGNQVKHTMSVSKGNNIPVKLSSCVPQYCCEFEQLLSFWTCN